MPARDAAHGKGRESRAFVPGSALRTEAWRALEIGGRQVRWRKPAAGPLTLRYAFARSERRQPGALNCAGIGPIHTLASMSRLVPDTIRAAAAQAFARWQHVSTLHFAEVDDEAQADIVIGEQLEPEGHAFTNVDLGDDLADGARAITAATICLNPRRHWKIGFDGNLTAYDLVHTLTHEIGHAIGLDHPSARGHVMSFRYDETLKELTAGDIGGVVALYGSVSDDVAGLLPVHAATSISGR